MLKMQTTDIGSSLETESCSHYWLIESPNGPTSTGECKICKEVRVFKNSIQITSWESDGNHAHRAHGASAAAAL